MFGYVFDVDCKQCGGQLEHVTSGISASSVTCAIAACPHCLMEWQVRVELLAVTPRGSNASPAKRAQLARAREAKVNA